jgi:uncharacterized protein YukE
VAGNLWGADVEQLRTLAQQFGQVSDTLLQTSSHLTNQINSTPAWKGNDANQFRSNWNSSHRALIEQTVRALKDESKKLLDNANQQERASDAAPGSGGGPVGVFAGDPGWTGDSGGKGRPFQLGPDWLADSENSPFRGGWETYNLVKAFPNLRAGLFDLPVFIRKADSLGEFLFSKDFRNVAKAFQESNPLSQYFNTSSELFDGRWDTALNLADGGRAAKIFDVGGKLLGGVGVGLDAIDVVNNFSDQKYGEAGYSFIKMGIGFASFAPPPVGTAAMVASGVLALYDNVPAVKETVNAIGGSIADGAEAAWEGAGDAADLVGDFFGF